MSDSSTRLHAFVSGMVQGVGFRYFVQDAANDVRASGWVRNLRAGRVEVDARLPPPTPKPPLPSFQHARGGLGVRAPPGSSALPRSMSSTLLPERLRSAL